MDPKIQQIVRSQFPALKVMLVDDMRPNIDNTTYLLTEMGFKLSNIKAVKNGVTGLINMVSFGPDLIITDWNMPVCSGLDMCKKIRENKCYENVPIIMVTAELDKDIDKAMPFVNAVLKKPYTMKDVEAQIFVAIAKSLVKKMQK